MQESDKLLSNHEEEKDAMPAIVCPHCGTGSNFSFTASAQKRTDSHITCAVGFCQLCQKEVYFEVGRDTEQVLLHWPRKREKAAEELPPNVQRAFDEALLCYSDGAWNGALLMCRRAINDALLELGAPSKGDLPTQLQALVDGNKITPALKDWADQARIGGKLSAHGTGGDEWGQPEKDWAESQDAQEVIDFCTSFFEYAFVMKARLDKRRGQT